MRILVAAASKHGSTSEIATALAAALRHHGAEVDVVAPERVTGVQGYDAVVVGSAVYRNRWLRPAREFVERFATDLRGRAVFLFSSGPIAEQGHPVNRPYVISDVAARLRAREHRMFAGKLDPSVLGPGERIVARVIGARIGDFRDWDAIGAWAPEIIEQTARRRSGRVATDHPG
ncbi:MAG: flavodoxin [Rhodococcus sp.]|uniref:flavodoxin domain-containing protein n=1 Tax=Rhodococcus TaxID=1827 RepID=UPI0016BCDADF|nr:MULTISPECIES: flavodoxin domain-containing protein [Rhodococcus]NLV80560.1 flavodoxin [Rhodococcus sp. (in: high G+C Gram-positive bacteria)]